MMRVDIEEIKIEGDRLLSARQVASPNWNERPAEIPIDLLVLHNISLPPGEFGGPYIDALFTNTLDSHLHHHSYFGEIVSFKVSSHCLIRRDGEIIQYVPFSKRAWHAGISCFAGREECNDFSIGIELEGADHIAYTKIQYLVLAKVINALQKIYPGITKERIVGHSTIAPERKTDPGPLFDWNLLARLLDNNMCEEGAYRQINLG
jgi:AmpD protein